MSWPPGRTGAPRGTASSLLVQQPADLISLDLAVWVPRQRREEPHLARRLVVGDAVGQKAPKLDCVEDAASARHDGGADDLAQIAIRQADDRRFHDVGMCGDGAFDLDGWDLLPAPVDQLVDAADDAKQPVRAEARQVSRAEPRAVELLTRGSWVVPVADHRGRGVHLELATGRDAIPHAG